MTGSRFLRILILACLAASASAGQAAVPNQPSVVTVQGTQLIVRKRLTNGTLSEPVAYSIKGVDWSPATRAPATGPLPPGSPPLGGCTSDQYGFFFDWTCDPPINKVPRNPQGHVLLNYWLTNEHQAHYQQDIPLMAKMHINTVRLYGDFGDDPAIYGPILDTFYNNGIMVVMTVPGSKADIDSARYIQVMSYCKNHPAILMWSIGNEWNFNLMFGYANLAAAEAGINALVPGMKAQDPNHPVSSSLGDAGSVAGFASITAAVPNVDVWALNIYRGSTFTNLFAQWTAATPKPFYFSEFGIDSFNTTQFTLPGNGQAQVKAGNPDEPTQATWDLGLWKLIEVQLSRLDNTKPCLGGFVFSWNDALWKVGDFNTGLGGLVNYAAGDVSYDAYNQDGFFTPGGFPDNVANEEYFGIVNADRVPKQAYIDLQAYYATLAPLPVASVRISPPAAALHYNDAQTFTAQPLDAFEESVTTTTPFIWSISPSIGASIDSSGNFTSLVTSGTFWVSVQYGVFTSSVPVVVANAPPTVSSAAAASPNPVSGAQTLLSVLGADDRGESNLVYLWTSTGPAATQFNDPQNVNASKSMHVTFSSAGIYAFTASLQDLDGGTTTSQVNVTVSQTLSNVTIQPASATLFALSTQPFTTTQTDQFGHRMNPPAGILWNASSGAIDASGLYTAGLFPGSVTVTGDGGAGLTDSALVTVIHSSPTVVELSSAAPNPVFGTQTTLTVLGSDDEGEANLRYAWSTLSGPSPVQFVTPQNTNAAKTSVATFASTGTYQFLVTLTDLSQFQTTNQVDVAVQSTLSTVTPSPAAVTLLEGTTQVFTVSAADQFGHELPLLATGQWVASGGIINSSGVFTAPSNAGTYLITFSSGGVTGTALVTVAVLSPPASLPPLMLEFSGAVAVDGELSVNLPAGFTAVRFNWTLTPSGNAATSPSYPTNDRILNLRPLNLSPGNYLVTVQAFGQTGGASPFAQGFVDLVPADFTAFRLYPSPWRSDIHSGHPITFDGLTGNTLVKIFTVSGHWVQTLGPANNVVTWDLKNDSGDRVASGLYLYLISNDQGQKGRGKFAIIR